MSIDDLRKRLEGGDIVFDWTENPITADLQKWIAFREGNREFLAALRDWPADRPYKHDPLPNKICNAFADFLFGEDATFNTANSEDAPLMEHLVMENDFASELHNAVRTYSSEGEVWWRIYVDPEQTDAPLVAWHSRTNVVPMWRGRSLAACAFIYEIERTEDSIFRYVQYHEPMRAVNVLYQADVRPDPDLDPEVTVNKDDLETIGSPKSLTSNPYTENLEDEWDHGLPILAGRLINNSPPSRKIGKSDFDEVEDMLLDLNETHAVDSENYKLAGKKRAVINKKYQKSAGAPDVSEEILWADDDEDEMESGEDQFKILEYSYDADSSIRRKEDLERIVITRVGLVRQFTDSGTGSNDGWAQSASALRTRLIPTSLAARGKAREWDSKLPRMVGLLQRVDALPEGQGGFGRSWVDPISIPSIARTPVLPEDPAEEATRHRDLVSNELESILTAIEEMHPLWSPMRRQLEVRRIMSERDGVILDDEGQPIDPNSPLPKAPTDIHREGEGEGGGGSEGAPSSSESAPAPSSGGEA
jgi:hypothetical protein